MYQQSFIIKEFPRSFKLYINGEVKRSINKTKKNRLEVLRIMKGSVFDNMYYMSQTYGFGYQTTISLDLIRKTSILGK